MTRQSPASCLALLAVIVAGLAAGPASQPAEIPNSKALLNRHLPEVKFDGVPLEDALRSFAELTHVSVVANWPDLESTGVKRDAKINVSGKDLSAAEVLRRILRAAGPNAGYSVERNVAYVATEKERSRAAFSIGNAAGDKSANQATARLLARGVPRVKFDGVQLGDALNFCRDTEGLPLEVDWDFLKKAGLEPDMRITVDLEHVAAGDIIYWILRPLPVKTKISWSLNNGKFRITAEPPGGKP